MSQTPEKQSGCLSPRFSGCLASGLIFAASTLSPIISAVSNALPPSWAERASSANKVPESSPNEQLEQHFHLPNEINVYETVPFLLDGVLRGEFVDKHGDVRMTISFLDEQGIEVKTEGVINYRTLPELMRAHSSSLEEDLDEESDNFAEGLGVAYSHPERLTNFIMVFVEDVFTVESETMELLTGYSDLRPHICVSETIINMWVDIEEARRTLRYRRGISCKEAEGIEVDGVRTMDSFIASRAEMIYGISDSQFSVPFSVSQDMNVRIPIPLEERVIHFSHNRYTRERLYPQEGFSAEEQYEILRQIQKGENTLITSHRP